MTADQQKIHPPDAREKLGGPDPSEPPKRIEYLTAKQLAEVLQISESTIHKLRRAGKIPAVMLTDRLIRFNLKDVKHALRPTHQTGGNHQQNPASVEDAQLSFDDLFRSAAE